MLAALIVVSSWAICLLLTTALCAAARRGDTQLDPGREAALAPPPAASVPEASALEAASEVSVGRLGGAGEVDPGPQAAADLALQSG